MKKIFLFLLIIFIHIHANAQFNAGLKAGFNFVSLVDNTKNHNITFNPEYKLTYHFGITSNFSIANNWSLTADLLISNKGYKLPYLKVNFSYLVLPLLLNYNLSKKFKIQVGPELGIRINNYTIFQGDYISNSWKELYDFGSALGFEYSLNDSFMLTARYTRGLLTLKKSLELTDDEGNINQIITRIYNSCFQFSITYFLFKAKEN